MLFGFELRQQRFDGLSTRDGIHESVLPGLDLREFLRKARSVRRHILGRGRSWVPLKAPHMRPLTSGSKATQYVVLRHALGMPTVEPIQDSPPSSLRKRPMSV